MSTQEDTWEIGAGYAECFMKAACDEEEVSDNCPMSMSQLASALVQTWPGWAHMSLGTYLHVPVWTVIGAPPNLGT